MINIISLGAGVQSSTMALMAAAGEITPMPDAAIFADTQAEPRHVYQWLDWLETKLPYPVFRVTAGNLMEESLTLRQSSDGGEPYIKNVIPAFALSEKGEKVMLLRKCTADFKIAPLQRKQKEIMKASGEKSLVSWIGISTDEAVRMKPSRVKYITHKWPLIEMGFSRDDCLSWMAKKGFPRPPKSACFFCPYHNDFQWREIKNSDPESWKMAIDFESRWNEAVKKDKRPTQIRGKIFLHRDCVPLSEVDLRTAEEAGQLSMFGNECEGMCGV